MTAPQELALVPPKETALQVFQQPNGLDPYLQKIRAEIDEFVPDTSTSKGRRAIASIASKVSKSKTALDGVGKDLVAELKEIPKKIDAERKRVRDTLDAWRDEVRAPLNEWEAAEAARVAKHEALINHIAECGNGFIGGKPQPFGLLIYELEEKLIIDERLEEFEGEARKARDDALVKLKAAMAEQRKREAEQAELAELRRKQAEQEQKDREALIAREAAEKARIDAEQKSQAERDAVVRREADAKAQADARERQLQDQAAQAERDRIAAQQRAEQAERDAQAKAEAAAEAERQRYLDEQKEAARQALIRESDQANKAKVNRAALDAFVAGGMPEDCAKQAVVLIAKRQIPNISIAY